MSSSEGSTPQREIGLNPSEDFVLQPSNRSIARDDTQEKPRIVRSFKLTTCRELVLTQAAAVDDEAQCRVYNVPAEGDLDVYGDVVRIVGSLSKPGASLRIFCRRLELRSIAGEACVIDVSGKPGIDHLDEKIVQKSISITKMARAQAGTAGKGYSPDTGAEFAGDDGKPGGNGSAGGVIVIRAEKLESHASVELRADGGAGGSGGDGGNGGHGQDGGAATDRHTEGLRGGNGGPGGRGGDGGTGGKGGTIYLDVLSCDAKLISACANGGESGHCGRGGDGGNGGNGSNGHAPTQRFPLWIGHNGGAAGSGGNAGEAARSGGSGGKPGRIVSRAGSIAGAVENRGGRGSWTPKASGEPGKPGNPGKGTQPKPTDRVIKPEHEYLWGKDGAKGSSGDFHYRSGGESFATEHGARAILPGTTKVESLIGRPESGYAGVVQPQADVLAQLRMFLEHLGLVHLMSDVSRDNSWLLEAYSWIAALAGALEKTGDTSSIREEAGALARLTEAGLDRTMRRNDYFDRSYRHASLHSVGTLRETLETSLQLYERIDAAARDLASRFMAVSKTAGDTKMLEAAHTEESASIEDAIRVLRSRLNKTAEAIVRAETRRGERHRLLLDSIADFRKEFSSVFFDIEPERILLAIGQLAFVETPGMGALLGGAAVGELASDVRQWARKGLKSDADEFYEEKWLTSKVDRVGRDLHNISLADGFRTGLKGFIAQDDPDAYRLIATQRDFDELCEQFYSSSEHAPDAKQAMDDFVASVQARNAEIAEYNAVVARLAELVNRKRHTDTEIARIRESLASDAEANLNLAYVVAGVSRRRRQSIEKIVEELYHAGRAVMSWKMAKIDAFAGSDGEIGFDSLGIASLQAKMISLLKDIGDAEDVPHKYVPAWEIDWLSSKKPGVLVHFDRDETFFDRLLIGEEVDVRVAPPSSDDSNPLEPFREMYACRLLEMRAWLETDRSLDVPVYFNITHSGNEEFIDRRGKSFSMQHDPVTDVFEYHGLHSRPRPGESYRGKITNYWGPWRKNCADWKRIAPIGPFTHWRLQLHSGKNAQLRDALKGKHGPHITGLALEFRCLYATLDLSK